MCRGHMQRGTVVVAATLSAWRVIQSHEDSLNCFPRLSEPLAKIVMDVANRFHRYFHGYELASQPRTDVFHN
ncbi:hypothetical protein EYZ11_008812 [Aspergillus tanneri]|uniref:Uncharacterized protein n=1 Tax=Aspergillus tanneri TaxID=1220188 RepID=A0A4S3JBQ0_9EURO|nr:hypothetical protein EYZ11_008812 [Aspergillus tanneri]